MKKRNLIEILDIAGSARIAFENRRIPIKKLRNLYLRYKKIEDIDLFIYRARSIFPSLNCGVASLYIKHILKEGRIINGSYGGNNHSFLLLNNNIIIDITSDQYGGPEVYVGPLILPWSKKKS